MLKTNNKLKIVILLATLAVSSILGNAYLNFEEPEFTTRAEGDLHISENLEENKGVSLSNGEITTDTFKSDKIDLNTASLKELDSLPNVGEKTAQRIVEYRNANGGFDTIEDIMKVSGIGIKKFEQMKDLIRVN